MSKSTVKPVGATEQPKAPKVALEKDGCRVRLRGTDHALDGCLSIEGGQEIRFRLEPDRWQTVHPAVAAMLRQKFEQPVERIVPNWNPGGVNDAPIRTPRVERRNDPIIEFPEEK